MVGNNLYHYKVSLTRIIDGDTIVGDVDVGFDITLKDQNIRLLGIDAPEMRGLEKPEGLKTKSFVIDVLTDQEVIICSDGRDSFGRILADVFYGDIETETWTHLNKQLLEEGLAEKWQK